MRDRATAWTIAPPIPSTKPTHLVEVVRYVDEKVIFGPARLDAQPRLHPGVQGHQDRVQAPNHRQRSNIR